jgi:hypothetical protein
MSMQKYALVQPGLILPGGNAGHEPAGEDPLGLLAVTLQKRRGTLIR